MNYLTAEQILFIHSRLIEETGGSHGLRDLNLLLSATARPQASFENRDLYPDVYLKAAALLDSLIRNHPFIDGNKRTGLAAAAIFLLRNGFTLESTNQRLEEFTILVAQSKLSLDEISAWLRENTRPLE